MIRFSSISHEGVQTDLPMAKSWSFTRSDVADGDSFQYEFPWESRLYAPLKAATRMFVRQGESRLFVGMVDEVTVTASARGRICRVSGRGLGGLLEDNEYPAQEHTALTATGLISAYALPCGISGEAQTSGSCGLSVELGHSAMQAVRNFCRNLNWLPPRLLADGKLWLASTRNTAALTVTTGNVIEASWHSNRKDVISQVISVGKTETSTYNNEAFLGEGGRHRLYFSESAMEIPGNARINESMRKRQTLTVTLPGTAAAEPSELVPVKLPLLGIDETMYVTSCRSSFDGRGLLCELELARF